jgi:HAE1 family hydrophobic/amphiphilic exporter-1
MAWLTKISLKNRSIVALATVAIVLIGAFAVTSLKQELLPSLDFPTISVVTSYPGAAPTAVEDDVTAPLEGSIEGVEDLETVTSYSNEGLSIIQVEYAFGTDIDDAQQELSESVSGVQGELPQDVDPQVEAADFSAFPVIQLAVTSDRDSEAELAEKLEERVIPELEELEGVGSAEVTGVRDATVDVTLDPERLREAGLSASLISGALQANNVTLPAGTYSEGGETFPIQVGNELASVRDIEDLVVGYRNQADAAASVASAPAGVPSGADTGASATGVSAAGSAPASAPAAAPVAAAPAEGEPVRLGDVATVEDALAPSSTLTRTNGEPSLGVGITKSPEGNTVAISEAVADGVSGFEDDLGGGAEIRTISDQAPFIERSIEGLTVEGLLGAGFAVLVVLLFLLSIRSTIVTAVSIPLSVVIALIALWTGDLSLNLLTLGGLTIAVGRVVDDSIVVLENIHRHLRYGKEKTAAILTATREVAGAITASTLTTVAVFLPIAFIGGTTGQLFGSFSIAVTVALLASLVVALTVVPVLAYWFMKVPKDTTQESEDERERHGLLQRTYMPVVGWAIDHRALTLVGAAVILAGTLALTPLLSTNFFEQTEQNSFSISQELPAGTSLEATGEAAEAVESVLAGVPAVRTYQVTAGSAGDPSAGPNIASYTITTDPDADQGAVERNLRSRLDDLSGAGTIIFSAGGGASLFSNLEANVQSSDPDDLRRVNDRVVDVLEDLDGTTDVTSNLSDSTPQVRVRVKPEEALAYGLTTSQVAQATAQIYQGQTVTRVDVGGEDRDVILKVGEPARGVEEIRDLPIPAASGSIPLGDVADVERVDGPTQVTSIDGERTATVSATSTEQNVGEVSADLQRALDALDLPDGTTVTLGGVTQGQQDSFADLGLALAIAVLLVYLIMVATFRSLLQPLLLLISIPFAATGAIGLLLITGTALGVPSLFGALMLVGIVVTNAIVLLDLIRQYREGGMGAREAVLEGGRHRLRPILMTAAATILALTPMAVGVTGEGAFISQPLAVVVIGGLISSTVLTLLLVPTLYMVFERRKPRESIGNRN